MTNSLHNSAALAAGSPSKKIAVTRATRLQARAVASIVTPAFLALLTFAVFAPALRNGFVNWDDTTNFLNNPDYRGLGWRQLRWMLTTFLLGQWIPLTWLTLGVDYAVWQMNPFGYHLTNVMLHCATVATWYFVARRLLLLSLPRVAEPTITVAAFASALFFSIHPLRAESVAWITERRDVLSGLFFMLTILCYLRANDGQRDPRAWIRASIAFYVLAALSKSIVVTLPVVLILLDIYPLRRFATRGQSLPVIFKLMQEKWLYFAIALATGVMAIWAQWWNNFLTPLESLPLMDRIPVMLYSVCFYFVKTIAPIGLSPLYELPARVSLLDRQFLASAIAALAAGVTALVVGRRCPGVLIAWVTYLVLLSPVSGLVHNGYQLAHDRYSYLSCLPWAVLFGVGLAWVYDAGQRGLLRPSVAAFAALAAGVWLLALATLAVLQTKAWQDDDTLWRYALDADPKCSMCHVNLGISLLTRGLIPHAIGEFEQALALRPDRVRTRAHLGIAFMRAGRLQDAVVELRAVLARYPDDLNTANNLAVCLLRLGRAQEGRVELQRILMRDPGNLSARANLGVALIEDGKAEEGVSILEPLVVDKPDHAQARAGLVRGYLALNRYDAAQRALEALRAVDPRAASHLEGLFVSW